jgi:hypothetical protein
VFASLRLFTKRNSRYCHAYVHLGYLQSAERLVELPLRIKHSSSHRIVGRVLFIAGNFIVSLARSQQCDCGLSERRSLGVFLAIRRPSRQPKRPNKHLEQLDKVLPSTVFINWYNKDLEEHPERRHLDLEDQVW